MKNKILLGTLLATIMLISLSTVSAINVQMGKSTNFGRIQEYAVDEELDAKNLYNYRKEFFTEYFENYIPQSNENEIDDCAICGIQGDLPIGMELIRILLCAYLGFGYWLIYIGFSSIIATLWAFSRQIFIAWLIPEGLIDEIKELRDGMLGMFGTYLLGDSGLQCRWYKAIYE